MSENVRESLKFIGRYENESQEWFRAELPAQDPDRLMRILVSMFLTFGLGLFFLGLSAAYGDVEASGMERSSSTAAPLSQHTTGIVLIVTGIPLTLLLGMKKSGTELLEFSNGTLRVQTLDGDSVIWPLEEVVVELGEGRLNLSQGNDSKTIALSYPDEELEHLRETIKGYREV